MEVSKESRGKRYVAAGEGESYNEQERKVQQDVKKYKNRKNIEKQKRDISRYNW